jgi:hypothetical protein
MIRDSPFAILNSHKENRAMNEQALYEAPVIVYEGELEIQAGSPLSVIADFDELDW